MFDPSVQLEVNGFNLGSLASHLGILPDEIDYSDGEFLSGSFFTYQLRMDLDVLGASPVAQFDLVNVDDLLGDNLIGSIYMTHGEQGFLAVVVPEPGGVFVVLFAAILVSCRPGTRPRQRKN
jgi:hypothetical protein